MPQTVENRGNEHEHVAADAVPLLPYKRSKVSMLDDNFDTPTLMNAPNFDPNELHANQVNTDFELN